MMDTSTIFILVFSILLGVAAGSLIQRALDRRPGPPPSQASTSVAPTENKLASEGDIKILRAWRTLSGRIWLEMDGARLNGKESLQPDQRRRLVSMLIDIRPWLENTSPAAAVSDFQTRPAVAVVPLVTKGDLDVKEIKPGPVLKSIVEQIDDVLQAKLLDSSYKNRGIHLKEGPGGVVLVIDGLNNYEGIEAEPDTEIQALIRQAVAMWEQSSH